MSVLVEVLTDRRDPRRFGLSEWDSFLVEARNAGLLARLGARFNERGWLEAIPRDVLSQIEAEYAIVVENQRALRWEVNRIRRALVGLETPIILLKGAAYLFSELPPATGRHASDVDILVPKARIGDVEATLLRKGWESMKLDPYDQRYYRTWMHELPPLCHRDRDVVVDVHHTILPETGRLHPDATALIQDSIPVDGDGLRVLAPEDMVLHSAAHLFQDGELNGGLRDLVDLDALLRHFGERDGFWEALSLRAKRMDLARPLYYAARYCHEWLDTPVPDVPLAAPGAATLATMDALTHRALSPDGWRPKPIGKQLARWLLYVRSHWLRMPPLLLAQHLLRKAWSRTRPAPE